MQKLKLDSFLTLWLAFPLVIAYAEQDEVLGPIFGLTDSDRIRVEEDAVPRFHMGPAVTTEARAADLTFEPLHVGLYTTMTPDVCQSILKGGDFTLPWRFVWDGWSQIPKGMELTVLESLLDLALLGRFGNYQMSPGQRALPWYDVQQVAYKLSQTGPLLV